ncbi:hypothetical protein FGG08_002493 [Glutinoglossum americanum]|uniref:Uncharacterized protein n=1 Tax=Glutinoglossum americanum TaxID=1670608 RepID=A0A9P8I4N8_9PEZI|nr:hypothetical protein FGG08_002493 [Glutinoglossum americanum]
MSTGTLLTLGQIVGDDSYLFYDSLTWNSALHTAASKGQLNIVRALVSCGFPVDLQNASGQSALHLATLDRRIHLCEYLLEAGADPLLEDDNNTTSLDIATRLDDFVLVDLLLSTNPPLQCPSRYLATALGLGQEEVIRAFIHNGFSLRIRDASYGGTLLHAMAMISHDLSIFLRLLDEGVDVNARDYMGASALHVAAQKSPSPEVLQLLLDAGADINAVDNSEFRGTPLFAAILSGNILKVKILIDGGANLFWKLSPKRTMLHIAAQDGIPELVELLIKRGVDVNGLDENGSTAAYYAAGGGRIDAIKVMLNHGLELRKEQGQTMKVALQEGNVELVQLLLDHGASFSFGRDISHAWASKKGKNMPLLLLFCRNASTVELGEEDGGDGTGGLRTSRKGARSREELVGSGRLGLGPGGDRIELDMGEVDMGESGGEAAVGSVDRATGDPPSSNISCPHSLLKHAMAFRQYEAVAAAIECSADVSSMPKTALGLLCLVCAEYNLVQGIKALVTAGAPTTNTAAPYGWTALHIAAWKGNLEIVRIARAGGWDMCAVDKLGDSAMHIAASRGHTDIIEELFGEVDVRQGTLDGNTALHFAAGQGNGHIVSRLIEGGAIVNKADDGGLIPLHFACQHNRLDAADVLVGARSDLCRTDITGASPLHYSARYDSKEVLEFLLSLDVDLDMRTVDGSTPLHLAAEHGAFSVLQPLLDAGADPNLLNSHGKSPLEVAVSNKNIEIVKLLISRSQVRWQAHRSTHILFRAFQSGDRQVAAFVLSAMKSELGEKKARAVIRKMYPELLAELLTDPESTVSVCSLLVPYLPKGDHLKYMLAYHLLMSCIKYSDNTEMVRSLLNVHPTLARQVTQAGWRPLHSACKHGRSATVKILLRYGAEVDKEALDSKQTPLDLARKYSPDSGVIEIIERHQAITRAIKRHPQSRIARISSYP